MLKRLSFHATRGVIYTLVAALLLAGGAILGLRYWLLPNIDNYRPLIERQISARMGSRVAIGHIVADWDGLRPRLELRKVQVFDTGGAPTLELVAVDATVAWRSLLLGSLRFRAINILQPTLEVKRDPSGHVLVAGIPIEPKQSGGGLTDWLLDQRDIFIKDAVLSWEDQQRGAPPLLLDGVSLHLQNRGNRHRFGLAATPPAQLAGRVDIRGDLRGGNTGSFVDWSGRLYAELPYADGAAWRPYLPLPSAIKEGVGRGALRLWLDFQHGRIEALIGDVRLSDVVARFDETRPALDLAALSGRLSYRVMGDGIEISAEKLAFVTRGGSAITPTDFTFRTEPKRGEREAQGELRANHLELAVLASLLQYFPVDPELRARIGEYAPSGSVSDFFFKWAGDLPTPAKYSIKASVERGALKPVDNMPGVSGLTATIAGDERAGAVAIDAKGLSLALPKVFATPLEFDSLTAKAAWKRSGKEVEIELPQVAFANNDLAGTASGTYRMVPDGPGLVDLTGSLQRGEARFVGGYLPLVVNERTRAWLEGAILGGKVDEASLRLKGDLHNFPFGDQKNGQFLVRAKVSGATLEYSPDWPRIESIKCELVFQGNRMQIAAPEARIFGAKLTRVTAGIPDLGSRDPVLEVSGNASGPFAEKLRFISASPVKDYLGGLVEGLTGLGNGKLALKLSIPLSHAQDAKVAGSYDFVNASLAAGKGDLAINDINGRLQFSEKDVRAEGITAQILGGPATIDVASRPGGAVAIDARGRVSMDALRAQLDQPLLRNVQGSTEWRGELRLEKTRSELTLSAPLVGISSDLPEPLTKAASDAWPLTIKRQSTDGGSELLSMSLADSIRAEFERVPDPNGRLQVKRGVVSFGRDAVLPSQDGLWLRGQLQALDLDRWRELLKTQAGDSTVPVAGINLTIGALHVLARRFGTLQIVARRQNEAWQGSLTGGEVRGEFTWQSAGRGLLYARLKELNIPESQSDGKPPAATAEEAETQGQSDYPALDIVADALQIHTRKLGRLELKATPEGPDWRIEHLRLSEAEATLDAEGIWRRVYPSETRLKLKLNAGDVGQLLTVLGYPGTMKAGKAELAGEISWPGAPPDMVPGKLSGELTVDVRAGQFVKIQPGAGKLLGLMSLQSLPRRISFDFRDIFSEGFAFDSITGNVKIRGGLLNTEDFVISGSSARVEMSGDVNLGNETQRLRVKVIPTLSEGLSLATGIFGGPIAGVATLLVQKMLNNPIGRVAGHEYSVSGTWDNPTVVKAEPQYVAPTSPQ
jgi:uncharacterized protein (TIGR02099 family)